MNDRQAVQQAYDDLAETYMERARPDDWSPPEPVCRFRDELAPTDRLLDAGCGPGSDTLVAAGETGVGLDFSREQLSLAQQRVTGGLTQGDMTNLPFAADSFDAVSAIHSLIHVPLADHQTVLAEFARVLRPGGSLLVTEGGVEWEGSNPDWLDSGTEMRWSIAGREATERHLRDCGFKLKAAWEVPDSTTEDSFKPFFLAALD